MKSSSCVKSFPCLLGAALLATLGECHAAALKISEAEDSLRVKSPYLDLRVALKSPKFLALTVDSLGLGKARTNALRKGAVDAKLWQVRREAADRTLGVEFRRPGRPTDVEPGWRFEIAAQSIRLVSRWSKGERPEPLVLDFGGGHPPSQRGGAGRGCAL